MSKKTKIILISILLLIFIITMIIIAVFKLKDTEEPVEEFNPNYAINETRDPVEEDIEEVIIENININGREISHLERLTPEQYAAKSQLYTKLHNRVALDETEDKKVISEEISDASTKYDVFVNVTFSDGTTSIYVIGYDPTSLHEYLRCITLEEYEYFNSDENCG